MPTRISIDPQPIYDLLNLGPLTSDGVRAGDVLRDLVPKLVEVVEIANQHLEDNILAKAVGEMLLREANLKGPGVLRVSSEGVPYLEVQGTVPEIPSLKELRDQAKKLGVDPTPFGTKRRVLYDHLAQVKAAPPKIPRQKKKKKAPKRKTDKKCDPAIAQGWGQGDSGPMSAGPDETRISSALPKVKFTKQGKKARKPL